MTKSAGTSILRRVATLVAVLALGGALTAMTARGVRAGAVLVEAPDTASDGQGVERNRPLEGLTARDLTDASAARVRLGEVRTALVMVFDTTCSPCAVNMANWAELAHASRGRPVELLALTVEPARGAAEYWQGWRGVRLLAADTATLRNDLRLTATPTTLLVEGGAVRRAYVGPLSPAAKAEITQWVQRQ